MLRSEVAHGETHGRNNSLGIESRFISTVHFKQQMAPLLFPPTFFKTDLTSEIKRDSLGAINIKSTLYM